MTLRLKLHLIVGALTLLFALTFVGLEVHGFRASVREEVVAANRVATQLLKRTALLYEAQGTPGMQAFLQGLGRIRSNEIVLLDAQGQELYRSPPSAYKVGRDAPAWFAALIMPQPLEQSISFPDGLLITQTNASRATLDAWDSVAGLLVGTAGLMLAVNLLLYGVVGRTVKPFAQITDGLRQLESGRFDTRLQRLPGAEAAAIGLAFNRMAAQLQGHIDTERRAVRAEMELSNSRELARWVDQHIEQERRLIARELHDEFGQSVTALRSMALSIAQRTTVSDPSSAEAARLIADESSRLYDAMHGLIPRLAPLVLDHFGLRAAVDDLLERTQRSHPGLHFCAQLQWPPQALAQEQALVLYRAVQEGLTNALRHGQAQLIRLTVREQEGALQLSVDDDGAGLPPQGWERPGHYGLRWLTERVEGLRGSVRLGASELGGASLQVMIPLEAR